jgi:ATP-dependent DNA ligase
MAARDQARRVSGHRPEAWSAGLYSRPGNDLTYRFPLIVETLARLRSRSCIVDGEAVACDDNDWRKMKNADAPAVKREAEEDWGKERWR